MTGYGPTSDDNSWRHGGSSNVWRPPVIADSTVCAADTEGYCEDIYEASGCDCSDEGSNCGWTTCWDSVAKVLSILDEVQDSLCIDLDQVWAMGCSNGGMFTFELARDSRSAPRLKGIVPIVGQPHHGYSEGPLLDNIKLFGMWGRDDDVVPPFSNTDDPYKSVDSDGWWYTTTDKVMSDWTAKKGCSGSGQDEFTGYDFGISNYPSNLTCTQGCSEREDGPIVSCIFEGGHDCFHDFMWEPIFNYMLYDPGSCSDDDDWVYKDKFTCEWVSEKPDKRCFLKKLKKKALTKCPSACGGCSAGWVTLIEKEDFANYTFGPFEPCSDNVYITGWSDYESLLITGNDESCAKTSLSYDVSDATKVRLNFAFRLKGFTSDDAFSLDIAINGKDKYKKTLEWGLDDYPSKWSWAAGSENGWVELDLTEGFLKDANSIGLSIQSRTKDKSNRKFSVDKITVEKYAVAS